MFVMYVNDKISLQLLESQHAQALFQVVERERDYLQISRTRKPLPLGLG